ncbi:hypothetical protein P9112_001108 [Eukaryota sp. TZLM1-RC]
MISLVFVFLGCYLGNIDEVKSQLSTLLTQFGNELESIENLNIEKHLKFFFLKICYSGKFTHILRSTSPSISLEFCRIFNEQRTNFLAKLLEIDASQLRSHIFCGTNFGGVDFHKSSYLCKAAFIGGGKNFIYEFVNRFPEKIHFIENCRSSYLISLQQAIETLSPNIWAKCFPSDIVELPSRSLLSLPLTFAKLQKKILKVLENLDYIVRLSLAKEKNPVFANFLIDLEDSCSSCLISQIPNIYGLLLNDHQWTTAMRLRCFLWPCSLPNDLICRCKSVVTLSHILNCKYFITYRSLVHDSVRDQLYAMCKSFNIEAFIEPLVRKLSSDQTDDSFGKRRADLVAPGIDGVLNVVDVVSVDVCKNSAARLVYSADSPLSNAEKKKIKKYEEPLAQLGRVEHVKYQFVPFAISLFGNIGLSGLHFFGNFKKVLLNRSGKTMNSTFWLNRIVFCIFKSIPTMISKALLAIGVEYERNAVSRFSYSDASIVDFVSCNVANDTLVHRRKLNPVAALDFKAKEKHRKYDKEIEDANIDRNTQLVFIAFPFSINGRLSVEAETFLDDFQKMVKEKTMKRFDIFLWRSRIQFAIINRLPRFFNRIREALARQQANQDFVKEILV